MKSYLKAWEVSSNFQRGFCRKHGHHMGYIINNDVIFWDCPACGYLSVLEVIKNIIQLNVLTIFLYKFIEEASK